MLCTPYRCSQDKKNIRRQLCNWSGKTLALVGLEEVLVAAYGQSSREKLPFTGLSIHHGSFQFNYLTFYAEVSDVLTKTVNLIENDTNVCGVCGKPKKVRESSSARINFNQFYFVSIGTCSEIHVAQGFISFRE